MRFSGGAKLARALRRNGVKVVFGIPGTHTVPLYKGLQELQPDITTITTRHESGAGYAADARRSPPPSAWPPAGACDDGA